MQKSMTTGQKIKAKRTFENMSRNRLSEITGINANTLRAYETDRCDVPLSYAVRIADALGVSLDYLARCDNG